MIDRDELRAGYNRMFGTVFLDYESLLKFLVGQDNVLTIAKKIGVSRTLIQNDMARYGIRAQGRTYNNKKTELAYAYLRKYGKDGPYTEIADKLKMSECPVVMAMKKIRAEQKHI